MEAKANLKEMSFKKKVEHIWEYYKFPILGGILAIYIAISTIYSQITAKECLLKVLMVNSAFTWDEDAVFGEEFLNAEGFDTRKNEIAVSPMTLGLTKSSYEQDYYTIQAIFVRLASGDVDIMSAPADIFRDYADEGYFINLNDIFTEEELASYEDRIIYGLHPETKESYPCAFDLSGTTWITENRYYISSCPFGIVFNCADVERAKSFLTYYLN